MIPDLQTRRNAGKKQEVVQGCHTGKYEIYWEQGGEDHKQDLGDLRKASWGEVIDAEFC